MCFIFCVIVQAVVFDTVSVGLTNAGMGVTCPPLEFQCHETHRCIPQHLACDGIDHCGDGSDELGCGTSMSTVGIKYASSYQLFFKTALNISL